MKITIENEQTSRYHRIKQYTIDIEINGESKTLEFWKSWDDDDMSGYETDWEWETEADKKTFDALKEENQEEIIDWIEELI